MLAAYSSPVVWVCTPIFLPFAPARIRDVAALADQERLRGVEVGVGEVDVLLPLGGDRDAGCRHVALAGVEERARLEVLEGGVEERLLAPSFLAALSTMSTSNPTTLPFCSNWNGGYGRWVQVVSTPALASPEVLCWLLLEPPPDPPHAARTQLETTRESRDRPRAIMASG